MSVKRWVIQRSDGKWEKAKVGTFSADINDAFVWWKKPYAGVNHAVEVLVTIRPLKGGKR